MHSARAILGISWFHMKPKMLRAQKNPIAQHKHLGLQRIRGSNVWSWQTKVHCEMARKKERWKSPKTIPIFPRLQTASWRDSISAMNQFFPTDDIVWGVMVTVGRNATNSTATAADRWFWQPFSSVSFWAGLFILRSCDGGRNIGRNGKWKVGKFLRNYRRERRWLWMAAVSGLHCVWRVGC